MKMMNMRILYILGILILLADSTIAFPQIPETYVGKVYINNGVAPINTPIVVKSASGREFKTVVATNSGDYSVDIILDDPDTSAVDGARENEILTWYIGGNEVTSCNRISPCRDTANSGDVNANFDIAVGNIPATTIVQSVHSTTTVLAENGTGIIQDILKRITNGTEEKKELPGKAETKGFSWWWIFALLIILVIIIIIIVIVAFLLLRKGGKKKSSL